LTKLQEGLRQLEQQRRQADPAAMTAKAPVYRISPAQPFDSLFHVTLLTPESAPAGNGIEIRIKASAPDSIKWIHLFYRAVNQQLEYRSLPMMADGSPDGFRAVIPSADIDPAYDLMYYIELMDKHGHGRIYPDVNKETPYKIINLIR
jgi:hypothetical protein